MRDDLRELSDADDARSLKQLEEALRSERTRQRILEERRTRELKQVFERAANAAQERAATLAFVVEDLQAEVRRLLAEIEGLETVHTETMARLQSLTESLGISEERAATLRTEAVRVAEELERVYSSRSWRLAALLSGLRRSRARPRAVLEAIGRWRHVPVPVVVLPLADLSVPTGSRATDQRRLTGLRGTVSVTVDVRRWNPAFLETLLSLQGQTLSDVHTVLVHSGADSLGLHVLLDRLADLGRVTLVRRDGSEVVEGTRGPDARYRCDVLAPVRLHPTFLEKSVIYLDAHPEVDAVYPWIEMVDGSLWPVRNIATPATPRSFLPDCAVIRSDRLQTGRPVAGCALAEPLVRELVPAATRQSASSDRVVGCSGPKPVDLAVRRRLVGTSGLRPLVLSLPWFTVGGADRMEEALLQHWREQGRHVIALTTVELESGMTDRFRDLLHLTPFSYHLPRLLPESAWTGFVHDVMATLSDPALLNIGGPWMYRSLPELRSRLPGLRVLDQQFNDIDHLAANRGVRHLIDVTIAAYSELADAIRADGRLPSTVEVVPVGIPSPRWPLRDEVDALRHSLEIPEDHRVISFVGRFSSEKRPEWAMALAADLAGEPRLSVVMVGDGPLAEVLGPGLDAIPGLAWRRSLESIEPLLSLTDVLIIPSSVEGIPLIAMEALSMGTPVVATRVGGLPEIQKDPLVHLCDRNDYPGFVSAVRAAVGGDPGERMRRADVFPVQMMLEHYDRLIDAGVS